MFPIISIGIEFEKLNKKQLKFLKLYNSSFRDLVTRKNQKMKIIKIIVIMFVAARISVVFPFQRQLPKSKTYFTNSMTKFIFYLVFFLRKHNVTYIIHDDDSDALH